MVLKALLGVGYKQRSVASQQWNVHHAYFYPTMASFSQVISGVKLVHSSWGSDALWPDGVRISSGCASKIWSRLFKGVSLTKSLKPFSSHTRGNFQGLENTKNGGLLCTGQLICFLVHACKRQAYKSSGLYNDNVVTAFPVHDFYNLVLGSLLWSRTLEHFGLSLLLSSQLHLESSVLPLAGTHNAPIK